MLSPYAVTVPGAAAGWCDVVDKFGSGKLSMEQILAPAIELGEKGFPVSELMGFYVSYDDRRERHAILTYGIVEQIREDDPWSLAQFLRDVEERCQSQGWMQSTQAWRDHEKLNPGTDIQRSWQTWKGRILQRKSSGRACQGVARSRWLHDFRRFEEPHGEGQ